MTDQETKQTEPGAMVRGRTRKRRTRTREVLLESARSLMARRSREDFTVDEVVQIANVAKGSFYNHFPDKEALASEVYRIIREKGESELTAANSAITDPVAKIARGMAVYARFALLAPDEGRILALDQPGARRLVASHADLLAELRAGLHAGRIVVPSIEAGVVLIIGQTAALMNSFPTVHAGGTLPLTQQVIAMSLMGLGVDHREAHLIASQAVEAIIATGSDAAKAQG